VQSTEDDICPCKTFNFEVHSGADVILFLQRFLSHACQEIKMRTLYSIIIASLVVFSSCKKSGVSNTGLIGRWQETESYISPAGPTDWKPSTTHLVIEFRTDGKLLGLPEINRYKILSDSTIEVWSTNGNQNYTWQIRELTSTKLELWYSCFEGCASRFKSIR